GLSARGQPHGVERRPAARARGAGGRYRAPRRGGHRRPGPGAAQIDRLVLFDLETLLVPRDRRPGLVGQRLAEGAELAGDVAEALVDGVESLLGRLRGLRVRARGLHALLDAG